MDFDDKTIFLVEFGDKSTIELALELSYTNLNSYG
jgi:hypothetical protein